VAYQNPVVVIPGITASSLVDEYPLKTEQLWSMVFNKEYKRIALHPDDLRYEAIEPARVVRGEAFSIYDDLIKALRHELSARADHPTPVFAFPYDWRRDISSTARELESFVDEVLARTRLLKHYKGVEKLEVDLVGHSMGGLVICEYLSQMGKKSKVGKVATIGTPYLGSVEAVVKIATGMSLITGSQPKEREREAARVTPALYQMFPSYSGAAVNTSQQGVDLFDPDNMQSSIIDSLTEFVRIYSVNTRSNDRRNRAHQILTDMLSTARAHRRSIEQFNASQAALTQSDWLAIIGVGQKTRIQLTVEKGRRGSWFVIDDNQFINELDHDDPRSLRTGDGTVPVAGAIPPFLSHSKPVCVTEDDLGFFELRDRLFVELGGFHGLLPGVNLVQRLVTRHLLPEYRGRVWGRRVPGARSWKPPIDGLQEKSY